MDIVNRFRNHPTLNAGSIIDEICQPLKTYGIDFFVYGKTSSDKKRIFLSTDSVWNEHYITNVYNLNYLQNYVFEEHVQSNYLLSRELYPENVAFKDANEKFGLCHAIIMPFISGSTKEVCYFGTRNPDPSIFNFFLQNVDTLSLFKSYFKEKAALIIKECEKDKLPCLTEYLKEKGSFDEKCLQPLPSEVRQRFLSEINCNKYYLPNDPEGRYLTKAEYNSAVWLLNGKSAEEIGIILGISGRTVEIFVASMKNKFGCGKVTSLVCKLINFGLPLDATRMFGHEDS